MWIVRLALRRPYTFTVMGILIVVMGLFSALRMPKDIFPSIDIPVVAIVWNYGGLAPSEIEKRIPAMPDSFIRSTINFNSWRHSK